VGPVYTGGEKRLLILRARTPGLVPAYNFKRDQRLEKVPRGGNYVGVKKSREELKETRKDLENRPRMAKKTNYTCGKAKKSVKTRE